MTKVSKLIWENKKIIKIFPFKNLVALIYPCPTKRQFLSLIGSVYESLGHINTFVFRLKVLFQMVRRES